MKFLYGLVLALALLLNAKMLSYGFSIDMYSLDGLRYIVSWALSWNQAGGNLISNIGYQTYAESWATTKIG